MQQLPRNLLRGPGTHPYTYPNTYSCSHTHSRSHTRSRCYTHSRSYTRVYSYTCSANQPHPGMLLFPCKDVMLRASLHTFLTIKSPLGCLHPPLDLPLHLHPHLLSHQPDLSTPSRHIKNPCSCTVFVSKRLAERVHHVLRSISMEVHAHRP